MLRWDGLGSLPPDAGPCVVSVGVFDGVHRGHAVVLDRTVARARARGLPAVVVTFDPHPLAVLRPELAPPLLSTLDHRLELFAGLGLDAAVVLGFDREMASWSPGEFVERVLVRGLAAAEVVVGRDFRFGHHAAGDLELLEELGRERGYGVEGVGLVVHDGVRWSSTHVRQRIAAGDVEAAAQALGRPHRVTGTVVHGDRRGRELGYPTANLGGVERSAVPADGVYAGRLVRADGTAAPAAVSIGTNPTFDGAERRVEAYVLDRDDLDLYGERVGVDFVARLRATERFAGVPELLAQMARDVARTREVLADAAGSGTHRDRW